jgi:hypothetical protein
LRPRNLKYFIEVLVFRFRGSFDLRGWLDDFLLHRKREGRVAGVGVNAAGVDLRTEDIGTGQIATGLIGAQVMIVEEFDLAELVFALLGDGTKL